MEYELTDLGKSFE